MFKPKIERTSDLVLRLWWTSDFGDCGLLSLTRTRHLARVGEQPQHRQISVISTYTTESSLFYTDKLFLSL